MKKFLSMLLVVVLTASICISGTVAYLQEDDSDVNVMSLGNVSIEQLEYQRAEGVDHNAGEAGKGNGVKEGALVPFKQGQALYPAVPADNTAYTAEATDLFFWGDYVYSGTAGNGLWNDDKLSNAMDKMVFVKNTGKSDAYFRTVIAFECPEGMEYSEGSDKEFMMNVSGSSLYEWEDIGYTKIDDVRYLLKVATYQIALAPGNQAHPSLLQVVMTHNATNEDMELLGDTYEILVVSQAVQTNGFADAQTALDTAFDKITIDNHPWSETVFVQANDKAELMGALTSGKDVVVNTDIVEIDGAAFNGNDTEVTLAGVGDGAYGYLAFVPEAGEDTKVENLSVTGSGFVEVGHWGMGGGDYTVNNLKVENLASTLANGDKGFTLACGFAHYGNAVLNNCVMTGTTAVQKGAMPVDLGCVNDTTTVINDGEYGTIYCWSHAIVTIDDADIDKLQVAPIKGTVTVKAGTDIETINVDYNIYDGNVTKARLEKLVIEDGANVGAIVFRGNSYTVAAWNAYVASL